MDRVFFQTFYPREELTEIYRIRYENNLVRLQFIDVILAQSNGVKRIYEERTGRKDILVAHSSLDHIDQIRPKRINAISLPIHFATLNGALAPYKGAEMLVKTVEILDKNGYGDAYRLDVFGDLYPKLKQRLLSSPSVRWHGSYSREQLDQILSMVDVGMVPSVWEEVYGYVGIEFLAKGIPVIGNQRGGIVDYTINGCSGWVNSQYHARKLASIIIDIIKNPDSILSLNKWINNNRSMIIPNKHKHFLTVLECYQKAISNHAGAI